MEGWNSPWLFLGLLFAALIVFFLVFFPVELFFLTNEKDETPGEAKTPPLEQERGTSSKMTPGGLLLIVIAVIIVRACLWVWP